MVSTNLFLIHMAMVAIVKPKWHVTSGRIYRTIRIMVKVPQNTENQLMIIGIKTLNKNINGKISPLNGPSNGKKRISITSKILLKDN